MANVSRDSLPSGMVREIERLSDQFATALRSGKRADIEECLDCIGEAGRPLLLEKLISAELDIRERDDIPLPEVYRERFPQYQEAMLKAFGARVDTASQESCAMSGESSVDKAARDASAHSRAHHEDSTLPNRLDRFRIKRLLGRGKFGAVYLAFDPDAGDLVALKVPRRRESQTSSEPGVNESFREVTAIEQLNHPGIVKIRDVIRGSGNVLIAMEYVKGRTLKDLIACETLSPERAVELVAEIADAVGHAHQTGIYHCDLKPANILVDTHGRPRVADFGLAINAFTQRLHEGEFVGTPVYMAPEQVRGEAHRLDGRTDQWALGVILYEMLAGRRPFGGREVFDEIKHHDPKPIRERDPSVPAELERICLKCLSKQRSDRYSTMADLATELQQWLRTSAAQDGKSSAALATPVARGEAPPPVVPKGLRSFDRMCLKQRGQAMMTENQSDSVGPATKPQRTAAETMVGESNEKVLIPGIDVLVEESVVEDSIAALSSVAESRKAKKPR